MWQVAALAAQQQPIDSSQTTIALVAPAVRASKAAPPRVSSENTPTHFHLVFMLSISLRLVRELAHQLPQLVGSEPLAQLCCSVPH
mgnify:CR=1 FL=1